jgi:hypothetical protein
MEDVVLYGPISSVGWNGSADRIRTTTFAHGRKDLTSPVLVCSFKVAETCFDEEGRIKLLKPDI